MQAQPSAHDPLVRIVEATDEARHRRLTGPARPDERDEPARLDPQRHVPQDGLAPAAIAGARRLERRQRDPVRPRIGDFVYSSDEIAVMLEDIRAFAEEGVTGVVLGALTPLGEIDVGSTTALTNEAVKCGLEGLMPASLEA